MPQFIVEVDRVVTDILLFEAKDEAEAREKALDPMSEYLEIEEDADTGRKYDAEGHYRGLTVADVRLHEKDDGYFEDFEDEDERE
jgi:hypothetical protein